jgi:uncharacterized protein (DUF302 family)
LNFIQTLQRLEQTVEKVGMRVFARIDHSQAATDVGLQMPPTTVLLYGNPRGGTPLMLIAPHLALDLPLKVLVREASNGKTLIAFHPAAPMLRMAGVPDDLATRLDAAQRVLVDAVVHDVAPT